MEATCFVVRCWRCGRKNRVLPLRGKGAYHCDGCDAIVLDTEVVEVGQGTKKGEDAYARASYENRLLIKA